MDDETLRRMAEEWLARWASVGPDMSEEDERADMTVLLRRVATEAARLERERIGRIMHDWLDVPLDAYERRIKGGE